MPSNKKFNLIILFLVVLICFLASSKFLYPSSKPAYYYAPAVDSDATKALKDLHYYSHIPKKYQKICADIHLELHIPFKIIYNLVLRESSWRRTDVGSNKDSKGKIISYDIGLCQLNSKYFDEFYWRFNKYIKIKPIKEHTEKAYKEYFLSPTQNLWTGFTYLRYLLDEFDQDYVKALQAYNWGIGNIKRGGVVPKKVENYAKFIITN